MSSSKRSSRCPLVELIIFLSSKSVLRQVGPAYAFQIWLKKVERLKNLSFITIIRKVTRGHPKSWQAKIFGPLYVLRKYLIHFPYPWLLKLLKGHSLLWIIIKLENQNTCNSVNWHLLIIEILILISLQLSISFLLSILKRLNLWSDYSYLQIFSIPNDRGW